MATTKSILQETEEVINGDRREAYGEKHRSFGLIAKFWTTYLSYTGRGTKSDPLTKDDVGILMSLFKIARTMTGVYHRDNYVDICGYVALAAELHAGRPMDHDLESIFEPTQTNGGNNGNV